jgi:hypothetical protein
MILLYAHTSTPRLQYSLYLLQQLMDCEINITQQLTEFHSYRGIKINYSPQHLPHCFSIAPANLLFENHIAPQPEAHSLLDNLPVLFSSSNSQCGFDVLAASFYLASRYEEYLPYQKDSYVRYAHENSAAWRFGFLDRAILHEWAAFLAEKLERFYNQPLPKKNTTSPTAFLPTYDIDIAWSYLHKGLWRNLGAWLKKPSLERVQVLLGQKNDPFDCYAQLDEWHRQYALSPIYFFLVADQNGEFDKNILPQKSALPQLIRQISQRYGIGLHPSWQSGDEGTLLMTEKACLEKMASKSVVNSRQHYIRFWLPQTYRQLLAAGITQDYSMGYGSINGFRASLAIPHYWFDVVANEQTHLLLHPFCYMEANSFYEQQDNAQQALADMKYYLQYCQQWRGTCITIWHNHLLGNDPLYKGWPEVYEQALAYWAAIK